MIRVLKFGLAHSYKTDL